jgi:exonuclease III
MTGIIIYLSVLTLNVNGLNSPIKRHHLTKWIKKEDPTICCLQETHLTDRNKHRLRMKGWKKIYPANGPRKQAGVAILISDKVDFKPTLIKRDKEGHSILIKGEID